MTEGIKSLLAAVYSFGILMDWGWWIAVAADFPSSLVAIMFGWIPACFWPLHLIVHVWQVNLTP